MNVTDEEEQVAFMAECRKNCIFIESIEISNADKRREKTPLCSSGKKISRLIVKN